MFWSKSLKERLAAAKSFLVKIKIPIQSIRKKIESESVPLNILRNFDKFHFTKPF